MLSWAGIRKGLRDVAKAEPAPGKPAGQAPGTSIIGGTIMETTTMLMWSESNRAVTEALCSLEKCLKVQNELLNNLPDELKESMESLQNSTNFNTETKREMNRNLLALSHQIERLRDKMT